MELYTNSADRTVYLDVPIMAEGNSIDVTIYDGDELVHTINTVTYANGRYSAAIPFHLTQYNRSLRIAWAFDYTEDDELYTYEGNTFAEVVTPILSKAETLAIHPQATDAEIAKIERAVRHIIQAHTGQEFGLYVGTKSVPGTDSAVLHLPAPLLEFSTINGNSAVDQFYIYGDGLLLRYYPYGPPPVKADYYGYHQHVGGVIHNPYNVKLGDFRKAVTYTIDGRWGYNEVPHQVTEAAKLLVNDYACADQAYRDRYLTSMTAADWRIQYHSGAFMKTGNVRADQLLSNFVLQRGWTVI